MLFFRKNERSNCLKQGFSATLKPIIHPKANKSKVFFGKSFGKMKKRFAGGKKNATGNERL